MRIFELVCSLLIFVKAQHDPPNKFKSLLSSWEEEINNSSDKSAQQCFHQLIQMLPLCDASMLSRLYRLYALYLFYGLNEDFNGSIDFTKVYFWMKKSADLGNPKALFYVALLGTYKLDGLFNINNNLNYQAKQIDDLREQLQNDTSQIQFKTLSAQYKRFRKLELYVKFKHLSAPLADFYFAAIQNEHQSQIALAFKYLHGLGTEKNCSTVALYLNSLAKDLFIHNPKKSKYIVQNRRVDHMLYNTDYLTSIDPIDTSEEHVLIFESIMKVTRDSLQDVVTLGYNYYYGLNGIRRDFHKAFKIFEKIVDDTGNAQSKAFLASMIVEGLTDSSDYDYALKLFQDASNYNDSRAFNGLGYMYLNGLSVEKDIQKALQFFKKAADYNNADGNYNYGSLFLMPSTSEIDRNKRIAYHHLNVASTFGHPQAQYSLSLIFLDGVDFQYQCDQGAKLMHQAITRGPWAEHVNQGNQLFKMKKYTQSFIRFLEAATLGYHVGIVNSAVLADQFKVLSNENIQYQVINEKIANDLLYQEIVKLNLINAEEDHFVYLFEDYINLVEDDNLTQNEKVAIIQELMVPFEYKRKSIDTYIPFKLFGYCKLEEDGSCFLRYGDFYYYGIYEEQSFRNAYSEYRRAADSTDTPDVIKAHAYFNLGYMTTLGIGVDKNHTKAIKYFNQSLHKYPLVPGVSAEIMMFLVDAFTSSLEEIIEDFGSERFFLTLETVSTKLIYHLSQYMKAILLILFGFLFILSYGYKLKVQNSLAIKYDELG